MMTSRAVLSQMIRNVERTQCIVFQDVASIWTSCSDPVSLSRQPSKGSVRRYRYSFVYKDKPFSVENSRLSSLKASIAGGSPLTDSQVDELILRLTEEERSTLLTALQAYESNRIKAEYEGQLAATRWRSKLGRPSKLPTLGDVDPTGTYCQLSEDWLKKKYAENVPRPTTDQLMHVALHNAVPFIGFGFLDNFIMIIAGDYIDETLGAFVTLSTMAAAALGNTISDVLGIGSAWYVELAALKVGLKPPSLSPIQLDMSCSRLAANLGRVIGITIGCLLGMTPLLFLKKDEKKSEAKDQKKVDPKNEDVVKEQATDKK